MNWIRLKFGRAPSPPAIIDQREMNEDWKAGDLAVCIVKDFLPPAPYHPKEGDLLRVTAITEAVAIGTNCLVVGLAFAGKPEGASWVCLCFRKVRPQHDAADAEFVAEVKQRARRAGGVKVRA